jgi:hypothetical protein
MKITGIDDIPVFEMKIWMMKEMIDSLRVDVGSSPNETIDNIFLLEKEVLRDRNHLDHKYL